jgi:hypothetical protein
MAIAPQPVTPPDTNKNGSSNRKAAPARQTSSLTASKWPLIGQSAYLKLAKAGKTDAGDKELAGLSPTLVRLSHARNKVFQALQAVDAALRETRTDGPTPSAEVHNRLRSDREKLQKCYLEFPLEVR